MFSENLFQASCFLLGGAATARGSLIHEDLNWRTARETIYAPCEVPCAETGLERLQIMTGFAKAITRCCSAIRTQRSQSSIPAR